MAFSGALTLTDLNDYLGPSQVCTRPVESAPQAEPSGAAETQIAIDDGGGYYEHRGDDAPRARTKLETAEISLNDCLACSGCVTSAETVLIGQQSISEVREQLAARDGRRFVATISPQTIASLATRYAFDTRAPVPSAAALTLLQARVAHALCALGFDAVHDITLARHLALRAHTGEFFRRREARASGADAPRLPMLSSACPGWICYAEKAHSELLPFVSATKSPQQIAGILAKQEHNAGDAHADTARVYHVTVMPCYDKKLEASRPDMVDEHGVKEVDCVLTTGELHDLLAEHGFDPARSVPGEPAGAALSRAADAMLPEPGSSSGGYLFSVLAAVWKEWRASHHTDADLELRAIRSADYTEFILQAPTDDGASSVVFKGAQCYGFRNLQNLVRKLQRETGAKGKGTARARRMAVRAAEADAAMAAAYDYVEVMACPGGCVNGGGQMRPPKAALAHAVHAADRADDALAEQEPNGSAARHDSPPVQGWQGTDRAWVQRVEDTYWNTSGRRAGLPAGVPPDDAVKDTRAASVLRDAAGGALGAWLHDEDAAVAAAEALLPPDASLCATYQGVGPTTDGLAVQW
ncbi:Cytosolic Fe-S cluster assembly factor nar1 [Malassezia sp. CBS 17886]|nr:Cytosolic Fe-S cluster assembly factor nar1 [Malassezia sp. CBS 17886]